MSPCGWVCPSRMYGSASARATPRPPSGGPSPGRRDILITTPESLFLMLTSPARDALRGVETVILDEVHAVAGTKRGAHLAVSLERLDELLPRPARRIGLSATVRPIDEVARFLAAAQVEIVQPPSGKELDLSVVVPVEDMGELGSRPASSRGRPRATSRGTRSGRSRGEDARPRPGAPHHDRLRQLPPAGRAAVQPPQRDRLRAGHRRGHARRAPTAELMAQSGAGGGVPEGIQPLPPRAPRLGLPGAARPGRGGAEGRPAARGRGHLQPGAGHRHGRGRPGVQVESPPSVASGLQRVGRAGHQVGAVSAVSSSPSTAAIWCSAAGRRADAVGAIEALRYPRNPLDVLAQQIVAMVAEDPAGRRLAASAPGRALRLAAGLRLHAVLDMLAGRYPSDAFAELRPRLIWDRVTDTLTARPGAQRLAVTSGGTIPDRGLFGVFLAGAEGTGGGGSASSTRRWSTSPASATSSCSARPPGGSRTSPTTGCWSPPPPASRECRSGTATHGPPAGARPGAGRVPARGRLRDPRGRAGAGPGRRPRRLGRRQLSAYLAEQKQATGHVPDDRTLLVERFRDELGDWRLVVHSPFGAQVNAPWALALAARLRERYGIDVAGCTPTTASCCGCPTPPASRPRPTSPSSTRTTSSAR